MDIKILSFLLIISVICNLTKGCRKGNKEVGVCLHVYLERDFLSLENIVYPSSRHNNRYRRSYDHRKYHKLKNEEQHERNVTGGASVPDKYMMGTYGHRDWIEGPELEDHCVRLKEVLKCFEEVLVDCDSGYHFFRYRHLLYALNLAHNFVCATPYVRKERFLRFLKTIQCAEEARRKEVSCHRHNVSSVVWNEILRVEVGDEICDSLSTQRACLLEHRYIHRHCRDSKREEIYSDLSSYFLSVWCHYPIHPKLLNLTMMSFCQSLRSTILVSFGIPLCFVLLSKLLFIDK